MSKKTAVIALIVGFLLYCGLVMVCDRMRRQPPEAFPQEVGDGP